MAAVKLMTSPKLSKYSIWAEIQLCQFRVNTPKESPTGVRSGNNFKHRLAT